jgi:uncharacterized protein YdhG (YjbR/CyaY superfamily)
MVPSNDHFYLEKSEPNKSCLLTLRDLILDIDAEVKETVKYGMPCFTFHKKAFAYLWADKITHEPYVLFVEGGKLNFPELEKGNRARMKILRVNPTEDLPIRLLRNILHSAINLYN